MQKQWRIINKEGLFTAAVKKTEDEVKTPQEAKISKWLLLKWKQWFSTFSFQTPQHNTIWTGDPQFVWLLFESWLHSTDQYFQTENLHTSSQRVALRGCPDPTHRLRTTAEDPLLNPVESMCQPPCCTMLANRPIYCLQTLRLDTQVTASYNQFPTDLQTCCFGVRWFQSIQPLCVC